jgi:hypothetical protein
MTKKYIPEPVISPSSLKVRRVTMGLAASNPDVVVASSTGGTTFNLFDVGSGVFIKDVVVDKQTALTASSTGAFTVTLGVDTDPDGFILSSGLSPKTGGIYTMSVAAANPAFKSGYRFDPVADTSTHLTATLTSAATMTGGLFAVYVFYFDRAETTA